MEKSALETVAVVEIWDERETVKSGQKAGEHSKVFGIEQGSHKVF